LIDLALKEQLLSIMTLPRLVKTGLFKKIPPPTEDIRQELRLYRTVLDKALLDWFCDDENYRIQSKLWMDIENEDFVTVCDLANLEAEDVEALFLEVQKIFIENGQDKYYLQDQELINSLSDEEKIKFLTWVEPDEPKRKGELFNE
jgi:hypothetical protein